MAQTGLGIWKRVVMYKREPIWRNCNSFFKNSAPKSLQYWLTDRDSLTKRLVSACVQNNKQFSVDVISESWQKPLRSEAKNLQINPENYCFVRQVHLYCGDTPWVYARTIIPPATLHGELQKLTNLGSQPLGAVLFANKHIKRLPIQISKISPFQDIFTTATSRSLYKKKQEIWGRRSVFKISNSPLLVSEIFLPELNHFR